MLMGSGHTLMDSGHELTDSGQALIYSCLLHIKGPQLNYKYC